jgi:hypothetical protein
MNGRRAASVVSVGVVGVTGAAPLSPTPGSEARVTAADKRAVPSETSAAPHPANSAAVRTALLVRCMRSLQLER